MRYVCHADRQAIMRDLRLVYGAGNTEEGERRLDLFDQAGGSEYRRARRRLAGPVRASDPVHGPQPAADVSRIVYTTNTIEALTATSAKRSKPAATSRRTSRHQTHLPRHPTSRDELEGGDAPDRRPRALKIQFGERIPDQSDRTPRPRTQRSGQPRSVSSVGYERGSSEGAPNTALIGIE